MKQLSLISLFALSLAACAEVTVAAEKPETAPLIVAELFTSQGCSSCPPAERLFSTLAEREDILTIEWHVDVWDDLVHHGSRWEDPYSDKSFTRRQRSYNRSIRGKSALYTPQAVVNGETEGVGSRTGEVSFMLENARPLPVNVLIQDNKVTVGPGSETADIVFVRLLKEQETAIKGGENKGRKLAGKNIALDASVLGQTGSKTVEFNLPPVGADETCAVLVQTLDGDVGPVLGAAKC